jgi:hypothetical protein
MKAIPIQTNTLTDHCISQLSSK